MQKIIELEGNNAYKEGRDHVLGRELRNEKDRLRRAKYRGHTEAPEADQWLDLVEDQ